MSALGSVLFLAFQYPVAIPGVTVANFLRTALTPGAAQKTPKIKACLSLSSASCSRKRWQLLKMDQNFAGRYLNEGFSGGEKKRAEILQMATLNPEIAILDETDSGLDIDALRIVADGVNALMSKDMGVLVITHYQRLLNYIKPDYRPCDAGRAHRRIRRARSGAAPRRKRLRVDPRNATKKLPPNDLNTKVTKGFRLRLQTLVYLCALSG